MLSISHCSWVLIVHQTFKSAIVLAILHWISEIRWEIRTSLQWSTYRYLHRYSQGCHFVWPWVTYRNVQNKASRSLCDSWVSCQDGARPPSWIPEICDGYRCAILLPYAKFYWNRTIFWRVMAKKRFLKWRPSDILKLKIFILGHLSVIEFQICCCVLSRPRLPRADLVWWGVCVTTECILCKMFYYK